MRFKDQIVLVTGGSRGIGKAVSTAFVREGATVLINYRSDAEAAAKCLEDLPAGKHMALRADISDPEAVRAMADRAIEQFGRIDVLVNNAGVHYTHPVDGVTYEEWQDRWEKTLRTNLLGAANLTFCVAQHMIARRNGRIVMVSSRGAFRGEPGQPAYGASKAGLNAFGQSMALALAPYGIGVGIVAPGFVETDLVADRLEGEEGRSIRSQSPFNRVASPEEIARAVIFLADPDSVWTSGAILDVNGASYLRC